MEEWTARLTRGAVVVVLVVVLAVVLAFVLAKHLQKNIEDLCEKNYTLI